MKQLQQPQPLVELHQRGHRGMAKAAVGLRCHPPQLIRRKRVTGEERHDLPGQLGIRQPGMATQRVLPEGGQMVRHVKAAIRGEPGQQHLVE